MKKGNSIFLLLGVLLCLNGANAQNVTFKEEDLSLDTYSFDDPNPVPILKDNPKIYPYFKFEGYRHTTENKKWRVVTLENDYIKVMILPEIGGKVWGAIEKSTGKEFLYKNEVVKFRNIAMRGPWTSGGIEFNFGIIGHHPSTATPVDYTVVANEDGSFSCIVGNLDLPSRTSWRVEIRLEKDKAYFETKASWYNSTPVNQSYYNWMTAAAVATDDLEFFIPGDEFLEHNGDALPWPVDEQNRDLSYYKNNNFGPAKSYHIVGDYKDFFGGYYHNSKFGFGHWSPYEEMPGQKLWLWALSRSGGIWEDLLTDTDGQYIEFQAGRLFNQYFPGAENPISQANFEPYVMDRWREIWFPIKEIGGMEAANEYGIINIEEENGQASIGFNALQHITEELKVRVNGKQIKNESLRLKPMDIYTTNVPLQQGDTLDVVLGDGKLMYSNIAEKTLIKRPFHQKEDLAVSPHQELFMKGWEAMKYREFDKALASFTTLVTEDPSHQDAWVKLAELEYRRTNYEKALEYADNALRLDTYHPGANYFAGISYRAIDDHINALESLGWAAREMKYRSVAYAQMAEVYFLTEKYPQARNYAHKALDYNTYNLNARELLLILSRINGQQEKIKFQASKILEIDPLSLFAKSEDHFALDGEISSLTEHVQNEFPAETLLELALRYYQLGRIAESIDILKLSPQDTKSKLWLAFFIQESNPQESRELLSQIAQTPPDFIYPYRRETIPVLQWAMTHSKDWKFGYYLALNYLAVGLEEKGKSLLQVAGDNPDADVFYRFRARLFEDMPYQNRWADHEKALSLNNKDWKVWEEYIQFYLKNKKFEAAHKLSAKAYKKFKDNYNIGLGHAKSALNVDRYQQCIDVLKAINILPFEHASESKAIYDNAHIFLARTKIDKGKYLEAIGLLEQAKLWPENLGVGKPYDPDSRIQDYLLAIAYHETDKSSKSESLLEEIADYSLKHSDNLSIKSYFGILALRKIGRVNEAQQLVAALQNGLGEENKRIQLIKAFLDNDKEAQDRLRKEQMVEDEIWEIMALCRNF
ncbi:DUF5107 domain-containing protein [Muriicola sp. Z0-33]|uniref:DUF5107 domain-containing protein n=1 Tax=Muriicola sp. Z0-33 TaxID=2816957 RepID=UPI002238B95F|nr:DUF5107 domain-containing protein [Muriicola sp. Z0-33]MCW5517203.1 DUF5107 domain-containing protein [Muriicola sp. Z0-33]